MNNIPKNVKHLYHLSPYKKWIKLLPIDELILFDDYNRKKDFIPVANIILDHEVVTRGGKKRMKKRNSLIQFVPTINFKEFNETSEWLYIFLINNKIVKIGGTRIGLKGRIKSYLCGHYIAERGKSGDCSKTNGFIYNTFEFYLNLGYKIEMLGYKIPKQETIINICDRKTKIMVQTYHAYESIYLEEYKKKYLNYPLLNDNCDPIYKKNIN